MIIKARERSELAKRRAMFNRLCKLGDQLDDKIMRDPFPLLDAAHDEINLLRKAIEDIKRAISEQITSVDENDPIEPYSIEAELMGRLQAVERILDRIG